MSAIELTGCGVSKIIYVHMCSKSNVTKIQTPCFEQEYQPPIDKQTMRTIIMREVNDLEHPDSMYLRLADAMLDNVTNEKYQINLKSLSSSDLVTIYCGSTSQIRHIIESKCIY